MDKISLQRDNRKWQVLRIIGVCLTVIRFQLYSSMPNSAQSVFSCSQYTLIILLTTNAVACGKMQNTVQQ